ncbi:MAG: metal ABC transporter permease [Paracoccaceae bacterium]
MDWTTPFQFPFMQNAFLICALVAVPTALMSCFLVLRGWALMGDAVSHAVLPGIVLAYLAGLPLLLGAFVSGMICALATGYLAENSRVKRDTVMGVVFSGMFAFGIVLFAMAEADVHLDHILFGNILGVQADDLWTAGVISVVVSMLLLISWKDLLLLSFDPAQAQASGLRVALLNYGLLAGLSLTIVGTLTAAGLILAIGLLIAPGAIAFLIVRRFGAMLVVAVAVNLATMLGGTYLSFWLDSAPAPTIVLVQTVVFLVVFARRLILTHHRSRQAIPTD